MSYAEFCCRSGGSNMNGGGDHTNGEPGTAALYSSTNGNWNWTGASGTFTPTAGNPSLSVTVGDWANVFNDGSTTPVFIARVTAVNTTTISLGGAFQGTAPTNSATARSINVGGAWAGPSGAIAFPFNFASGQMKDASGNPPRINMKNNQTYSITAAMTMAQNGGVIKFQGYATTFGDGNRATIDGGTSGAAYNLLQNNGVNEFMIEDLIFQNNGATGAAALFSQITGGASYGIIRRCIFAHSRGSGTDLSQSNANTIIIECEAYDCNQSNTANLGGFGVDQGQGGDPRYVRCYAHDCAGSNTAGFVLRAGGILDQCIADTCGGPGFVGLDNFSTYELRNCDAYNNGGDGFRMGTGGGDAQIYFENCNFVKNGGWGINLGVGGSVNAGYIVNCGFGSGTQANASGSINPHSGDAVEIVSQVTYASGVTPWNAPATGDFTVALAAAQGAGRGTFTETQNSKTGTSAYSDIGAGQHTPSGGGGGSVTGIIGS